MKFSVEKCSSTHITFSRTEGFSVQIGMSFQAGIPDIFSAGFEVNTAITSSYTWGESKEEEICFKSDFYCFGAPKKRTLCNVVVDVSQATLPYTMKIQNGSGHKCKGLICESKGNWTGFNGYNQRMQIIDLGKSNRN